MKAVTFHSVLDSVSTLQRASGVFVPEPRQEVAAPAALPVDADLNLLRRFARWGEADAFGQIVHRYAGCVYATCLRVLGDVARAEDASQETFFRLMRRPNDVRQNLGAWLHRTATHVSLDQLRSESARKRRETNYAVDCDRDASTWFELSPMIDQALADLPEETRHLLVQHYLVGRTQAELAQETGQSAATISRRMKQALEDLRQRLRLKGICAIPTVLAGLLCNVAIRRPPPGLINELRKMALLHAASRSGSIGAVKTPMSYFLLMACGAMTAIVVIILAVTLHNSPKVTAQPVSHYQETIDHAGLR